MILRAVASVTQDGKNFRLTLDCGHQIKRGRSKAFYKPRTRAYCPQCSFPDGETHDRARRARQEISD